MYLLCVFFNCDFYKQDNKLEEKKNVIGMRYGQKRIRGAWISWSCSVMEWKLKVCKLRAEEDLEV